jgi:hypothetical protein
MTYDSTDTLLSGWHILVPIAIVLVGLAIYAIFWKKWGSEE